MTSVRILSVGSEILLGDTIDTNAAFLGAALAGIGVVLEGTRTIPDDRARIAAALAEARAAHDLVLVTGGLGPTHDDLTREALADALGEELREDSALAGQLRDRWRGLGDFPASNLRQAMRIPSAETLPNPIGSAPGWWVDRDGIVTVLLPGVPSEMRRMWTDAVAPRLPARFALTPVLSRTLKTIGTGESRLADLLGDLLARPGEGIETGIYARDDGVHLRFSSRDPAAAARLDACAGLAHELVGDDAWGTDADDLASVALASLGAAGVATVASWEADSGGALLGILAAAPATDGAARFVGGLLDAGATAAVPLADAAIQLSLLPQDGVGRSRARVSVSGRITIAQRELRIHGSGPQRQRRAAYAALDAVRRAVGG